MPVKKITPPGKEYICFQKCGKIAHAKNRSSGELSICLIETYKNSIKPNGCNIYNSAAEMSMATICPCNSQNHGLPHWKCVLHCCKKCFSISMTHQEINTDATNMC